VGNNYISNKRNW